MKNENKTKKTKKSPLDFIKSIKDPQKKKDSETILKIMKDVTGEKPVMWGPSIIGFGDYHYKYDSGREGDFFMTGFSPRTQNLTIYIMPGYENYEALWKKLGKHSRGKSCLYIKKLDDIHLPTLKKLIQTGYKDMKKYKAKQAKTPKK